ncbi:MAG: hypothetical protein ACREQP_12750 [Candidatus Binatia bacterium]
MKRYNRVGFLFVLVAMLSLGAAAGQAKAAQVRLSWKDASSNEDGFKIERKQGTGNFAQIALAARNATSYTDAALVAQKAYCYRVRAYNSGGNSAYSNTACGAASGTTSPPPPEPSNPTPPPPPPPPPSSEAQVADIGIFRPGTGEWRLDVDGNGLWSGCGIDDCLDDFGGEGDLPVVGAWGNTLKSRIGFFDSQTGRWYLDLNGNGVLDGCETSTCRYLYGKPGDKPVAGDWTGNGKTRIGVFRPSTGKWHFDLNGNGVLDSCAVDRCLTFGAAGDKPVTGDWTGSGITEVGIFRPGTRQWFLSTSAPKKLPGCTVSPCVYSLGIKGDLPVTGDWNGNGRDKIGVFRPSTGEWRLDFDGNGNWDGCNIDECSGPFGVPGDLPVAGNW